MSATHKKLTQRQLQRRKRRRIGLFLHFCIIVSLFCLLGIEITFFKSMFFLTTTSNWDTKEDAPSHKEANDLLLSSASFEDLENWELILVNGDNPIPDDYDITLTQLRNNQAVDSRCYPNLQEMMDDCRAAGYEPLICSSYRTTEKQQQLLIQQIEKLISEGYSRKDAYKKATTSVALPGTSEHQLGLAVDIVDVNYQQLNSKQKNTPTQKWLMENSWKYGFILRYPSDKSELTDIIYEPWHYRYVGKEAAKYIYEKEICLEEYISLILKTSR